MYGFRFMKSRFIKGSACGVITLTIPVAVATLVALVILETLMGCQKSDPGNKGGNKCTAFLASPTPLLEGLLIDGKQVFISPEFFPFISSIKADQASRLPSQLPSQIPSPTECREACGTPALFYRLNRVRHFSSVLLGSDQRSFPLVASLLKSPLWRIKEVNPWGLLFAPITSISEAQALSATSKVTSLTTSTPTSTLGDWQVPNDEALVKAWPNAEERAEWMIRTAGVLIAINQTSEAEKLLQSAEKTHRRTSELLEVKASLSALRGRWEESKNFARQSLGKDHSKTSARMTLIRALIETGDSNAALVESRRLMEETPPNEETLFLLARSANASGSAAEEITALEKLVELGRKKSEPLGASLTYLGQAYGKNGERGNALKTLQEALRCPELTDPQRSMIQEMIDHLGIPSLQSGR